MSLNWTKVGLKDEEVVEGGNVWHVCLNWTKVGLKVGKVITATSVSVV